MRLFAVDCRVQATIAPVPSTRTPWTSLRPASRGQRERAPEDRLDSWKEIAAYLRRDVTTAQRWEKREGMPVRRHVHDKLGSVYASRSELDAWTRGRNNSAAGVEDAGQTVESVAPPTPSPMRRPRSRSRLGWLLTAGVCLVLAASWWLLQRTDYFWRNPLNDAQFQSVTDFGGTEQAAAISRDGKFVAFLSDRDGQMDVWITQLGTGQFYNLTRGHVHELVNPSVRTLGFSPDGALVTFWARGVDGSNPRGIGIWAIPTLGGEPRPYLKGVAESDWSADGAHLVYHTPGPGDPTFVKDSRSGGPKPADLCGDLGASRPLSCVVPERRVHLFRPGVAARCHGHLAHQTNRGSRRTHHAS